MKLPSPKDNQLVFEIPDNGDMFRLFGSYDENLALLEDSLDVKIVARGKNLLVSGDEEELRIAGAVLDHLIAKARAGQKVSSQDVRYAIRSVKEGGMLEEYDESIITNHKGRIIGPRT